jgi:hypothetical protein
MGMPGKTVGRACFKLVLLSLSLSAVTYAQSDTAWLFTYPNSEPLAFFADDSGNAYVAGWSEKQEDHRGALLLKIDSTGHLVWDRTYDNVTAVGAVRDKWGNIYISGAMGGGRVFLLKYKSNGDMAWLAPCGGRDNPCSAMGPIAIDDSQNVYTCGVAESATASVVRIMKCRPDGSRAGVMNYALSSSTALWSGRFNILSDGGAYLALAITPLPEDWPCRRLIVRLSSQGRVLWERTYRGLDSTWDDVCWSQVDKDGSIYIIGHTTRPEGFGTMKMDSSGRLIWTGLYPHSSTSDGGDAFLLLNEGNVYVASGKSDAISLVKYDSLGNQLWHSKYGSGYMLGYGQGYDDPWPDFCCMNVDDSGNVYLTGSGYTTYSTGNGHSDYSFFGLLLKFDPDGKLVWAKKRPWTNERPDGGFDVTWSGAIVGLDSKGALYEVGLGGASAERGIYVLKYRTR